MEHAGEVWQEFKTNGQRAGGVVPAELDKSKVVLLSGAAVMLYRFRNGEVEFLFQHRSKKLKANPDKWDTSAGGHVNLNEENLDTAVREAYEEIGARIDAGALEIAATYRRRSEAPEMLVVLYFYDWGDRSDDFHFDDGEVEEVKWVKYAELDAFWPKLKSILAEDVIFRHYLDEWNARVLKRNENL